MGVPSLAGEQRSLLRRDSGGPPASGSHRCPGDSCGFWEGPRHPQADAW